MWELLGKHGLTHPFRTKLAEIHRAELFEHVVTSLAIRLTQDEESHAGVLNGGVEVERETFTDGDMELAGKEGDRERSARDLSVPREMDDFFKFCLDVCSHEEADYFGGKTGNTQLQELVAGAEMILPRLIQFAGPSFKAGEITRKILAPGLGRIETTHPHLSNKTRTMPGGDPTTGNPLPIFISISGTAVPIDRGVLREYVSSFVC